MNMNRLTLEYINNRVANDPRGFIEQCEREYDKRLDDVAERICKDSGHTIVMLAGPSSSGKTTTASMIVDRVAEHGRRATSVSLDDFYLDQNETPVGADGTPDLESVDALDVALITECLKQLSTTGECVLPVFSFITKSRESEGRYVRLGEGDIVVVEGLHALNPIITEPLAKQNLLKLYISASSRVYNDGDILLSKRQVRFIRRMVRDYKHRNSPVDYTFKLWKGVRKGEDKYLFPYSGLADIKINTMHPYEPCIFRDAAIDLLMHIGSDSEYYDRAQQLIEGMSLFNKLPLDELPGDSLLREFLS